jgi:hypothetical protein
MKHTACLFASGCLAMSLSGCFTIPATEWEADIRVQPLAASYQPGDSIYVEGTVESDVLLGFHIANSLPYDHHERGVTFFVRQPYPPAGPVNIKRDVGIGFYVTPDACAMDLTFQFEVSADVEKPSPRSRTRALTTKVNGKACN